MELGYYAGNSYIQLGYLYALEENLPQMLTACNQAVEIFASLPGSFNKYHARALGCVGRAYALQNRVDEALNAYREAIRVGCTDITSAECSTWIELKTKLEAKKQ